MAINFEDASNESLESFLRIDTTSLKKPFFDSEKVFYLGDGVMEEAPSTSPTVTIYSGNQCIYNKEVAFPRLFTHGLILGDVEINYAQIIETRITEYREDDATTRKAFSNKGAALGAFLGGGGGLMGAMIGAALGAGVGAISSHVKGIIEHIIIIHYWDIKSDMINTCLVEFVNKDKKYAQKFITTLHKEIEINAASDRQPSMKNKVWLDIQKAQEQNGCCFTILTISAVTTALFFVGKNICQII